MRRWGRSGGGSSPPETFTIGGTVTGLTAGQQVTLNNNGANPTTVTANGAFTFSTPVAYGGSYAVTVGTQPTGKTCTVANGSGSGVTANVTNVAVTCSTNTYTIGGTVSGLAAGQQVTLNNNGANPTTVTANGAFTFSAPVAYNGSYAVTVGTQPTGQTCTVANGSGSGVTANVTNVAVTCSTQHLHHRGHGLGTGRRPAGHAQQQRRQSDDGHRQRRLHLQHPRGLRWQLCGHRRHAAHRADLHRLQRLGRRGHRQRHQRHGHLLDEHLHHRRHGLGLAAGQQVTLNNNGANPTTVTANGAFTFSTPVASDGSYAVTVGTQPTGQTCTVSNGSGAGVTANVTNVAVTCSTNTYTIGGTVSGLAAGQQVTLNNNGANPTTVTANGAFTFSTPVTFNGSYAVTVGTQPTGQTCTVANGSGAGVTANVTNVAVTCSTNTYTIGGTVSGLAAGQQVTLNNNGANPTTVTANGAFTFSTPVAFGGSYAVTVGTQPTGQTCTVCQRLGRRGHRQRHQRHGHLLDDHLHHRGHRLGTDRRPAGHAQQQRRQSDDRHRRRRLHLQHPRGLWRQLCRHRGHAAHRADLHGRLQRVGQQRDGQRDQCGRHLQDDIRLRGELR